MGLPATATVSALQEYVDALEEEKRKMEVFQRELPLSLAFMSQAIEEYRRKLTEEMEQEEEEEEEEEEEVVVVGGRAGHGSGLVLEEFIPLRPATVMSYGEEEEDRGMADGEPEPGEKMEWLKSVQLWNTNQDDGSPPSKNDAGELKSRAGGQNKKPRRCWSPDLHRRFVHALQQLGGPEAATPKQIREIMKVDGLTNDEVKSHLQKYRMHTRTPNPYQANESTTCNPRATPPQVVLGIWMPPSKYPSTSTASVPSATKCPPTQASDIYTSISSLALGSNYSQQLHVPLKKKKKKKKQSNGSPRGHLRSENTMSSYSTATTGSF